jgi:hypothetical protein
LPGFLNYYRLNFYKTILALHCVASILIVAFIPVISIAQQPAERKYDSIVSNVGNKGVTPDILKIKELQFSKTTLLPNKLNIGDTLKKNLNLGIKRQVQDKLSAYDNLFREISGDMKKKLETPFSLTNGSVSLLGMSNNGNDSLEKNNYNLFDANLGGAVFWIPFSAIYQNHHYPFIQDQNQNRFSFQYDKDTYLNGIRKKLAGKFNPEDFLQNIGDPVQILKSTAEKSLHSELDNLKQQYKGLLDDKINQLGDLKNLFSKDVNSIRQSLVNEKWIEQLQSYSSMLAQLQSQINTGQPVDMQQYDFLKNELEKYKGTQGLINIIEANHKKWEESGLIKKIKQSALLKNEELQKILHDPGILKKLAKQKLDLKGIQKLFLSITKLNAGQTNADFSRLLTGNNLLHGLNTGYQLNNKKSFDFLGGAQRTINSVLDYPFTNNIFNTDNRMIALRFNKGEQNVNSSSFSFLSFQTMPNGQLPFMNYSSPRKSVVLGISRQLEINKTNHVDIEFSKSSGYFINEMNSDSSKARNGFGDFFDSDNFLKSFAASVNYSGEFEAINLRTETFVRYSGVNYDNPATGFIPGGTQEAGMSLFKTFLENKLQVNARTNWRRYKFSETNDNQWRNTNHFVDVKWKMRKGQSVSLRYQPARSVRLANGVKSTNTISERLAANATVTARLKTFQYRNNFSLAYLRNQYAYTYGQLASNKSFQLTTLQSFIVGKQMFYSNTTFTSVHNPSSFIYFNTSFNSDLGITYNIGKNISASSSINYNSVKGWYQQISCKQSLSGQLGEKLKMDIYVDIGKNIKELQPLPFKPYRAEWSIQYLFNR